MGMPSQNSRIGINKSGSRRNKRFGRRGLLIILVALVVGAVFFFRSDDDPNAQPAEPPANDGVAHAGDTDTSLNLGLIEPGGAESTDKPTLRSPLHTTPEPVKIEPKPEPVKPTPTVNDTPPTKPETGVTDVIEQLREAVPLPKPTQANRNAMATYNEADQKLADGDLVGGRRLLSDLIFNGALNLSAQDAMVIRNRLTEINQDLVFSKEVYADDPIATRHLVQNGEYLASIGVKYKVPYQLLEIVNSMKARSLQADRPIKVIRGPLHARVIKSQYLMDIFAVGSDGLPVYICSFSVGLGKDDKTPVGDWALTKGEKVVNPDWRDELTNEYYASNDPKNPIGEFWMAMHGTDDNTKNKTGFGIHGTIDPESIGTMASRGCIRLGDEDIELVFYMLTELGSTVRVVR